MYLILLEFVRVNEMEGIFPDRQKTHSEYKKENTGVFLTQMNYLEKFNSKNPNISSSVGIGMVTWIVLLGKNIQDILLRIFLTCLS